MPAPPTIAVAINPTAAFGRGRAVGPAVVALLRERGHSVLELVERDADALRTAALARIAEGVDALDVGHFVSCAFVIAFRCST